MSDQRYFITLKPTGPFFFGSEQNFGGDENYFAVSRHIPQQTTLLGVLRYKLLEAYGLLSDTPGGKAKDGAAGLIGPASFMHHEQGALREYGAIKGLTELTLYDGSDFYFAGHRDLGLAVKDGAEVTHDLQVEVSDGVPMVRNYSVKAWYPPFRVSANQKTWRNDCLFQAKTQVGIYRTVGRLSRRAQATDEEDEKGFYKKTSWVFADGSFRFGFFATIDNAAGDKLVEQCQGGSLTPIGGERSLFQIEIMPGQKAWEQYKTAVQRAHLKQGAGHCRAVLLSDAYVIPAELYGHCIYAMARPVPMRSLISNVDQTSNYYALDRSKKPGTSYPRKSELFQLMEAGSVFFLQEDQLEGFEREMRRAAHFAQIGYNAYVIHTPEGDIHYKSLNAD